MKTNLTFRRGDLLALGLVVLLALGLGIFFLNKAADFGAVMVEIRQDGELIETRPLNRDDTVTIGGDYTNVIVIRGGAVWMETSDCPGGDCVHSGKISASGRVIVCLPNRVEVRLVGGEPDVVDMAVG